MQPGSLVTLGVSLSIQDAIELKEAGYSTPRVGRDILEVERGPYLTMCDGKSVLAVTLMETGGVEWCAHLLLEVDPPKTINLNEILSAKNNNL
jgi:hypothetical protein